MVEETDSVLWRRLYDETDIDGSHEDRVIAMLAAHRQQAKDAMRERCLRICETTVVEVPLTNGACDGASIALHTIATAIRGIDAGGEGE